MRTGLSIRMRILNPMILLGSIVLMGIGCGGGGGGSFSGSGNSVNVSLASTPAFPAGTAFSASPAGIDTAAKPVAPGFDNVFVTITRVALLASKNGEGPDPGGEVMIADDGSDRHGAFLAVEVEPPRVIDLLHLPSGEDVARFLDRIVNVPAGTYGKIRVYYSDLRGVRGSEVIPFHPTANSHFDVHFAGGDLVIPVSPDPERGVHIFDVTIHFVGLKIVENQSKVLMRPQVFAVAGEVLYGVAGRVANPGSTGFDIVQEDPSAPPVHVAYGDQTVWSFEDPVEGRRVNDVGAGSGTAALREFTKVEAVGTFSGEDLVAHEIILTFEDFLTGEVLSGNPSDGWTADERLVLNRPPDNVVVPMPSRSGAVYDDAATFGPLAYADVRQGSAVKARGYFVPGTGIDAFWISVSGP